MRDRLARIRRDTVLKETAGMLKDADIPHWETPETASVRVREQRRQDEASLRRKLAGAERP